MYKLLLCWRYLRTRYLALVCIVSVMLGVATLIVVNSVMGGFSTKLRERLHGLLSDVVIESLRLSTASPTPTAKMALHPRRPVPRRAHRGDDADAGDLRHAPVPLPAASPITRPVRLIGIDPEGRAQIGGFARAPGQPKQQAKPVVRRSTPEARAALRGRNRCATWPAAGSRPMPTPMPGEPPPPDPPPSEPSRPAGRHRRPRHRHFRDARTPRRTTPTRRSACSSPATTSSSRPSAAAEAAARSTTASSSATTSSRR